MAAESRGMKRAREVAAPDDDDEFAHLFKGAGGASESEQAPISAEARAAVAAAAEAAEDVRALPHRMEQMYDHPPLSLASLCAFSLLCRFQSWTPTK